jgi:Ca2+-binding EF-hand superfamily protein
LIENAANCNLKFIYFWVFGLFDENSNGILQSQDLFRFLQKFGSDNQEIEHEIYEIKKYLQEVE